MSRGIAPHSDSLSERTTVRPSGVAVLFSVQVSAVWLSQASALAASHGASVFTVVAIWSNWVTTLTTSAATSGLATSNAVGSLAEYVVLLPPKMLTLPPSL